MVCPDPRGGEQGHPGAREPEWAIFGVCCQLNSLSLSHPRDSSTKHLPREARAAISEHPQSKARSWQGSDSPQHFGIVADRDGSAGYGALLAEDTWAPVLSFPFHTLCVSEVCFVLKSPLWLKQEES